MNLKLPLCIALSAALLISALSCNNSEIVKNQNEQTVISLSWWGNDTRHAYTIEAVEKFELLHPDIKVMVNYSEWSGYEARSRVQMISKTESDVMQINFNWLNEYSPDGSGYYDINKLSDIVDLSTFSDDILEYGTVNGKLNGVPIAMNCMTVYINKTVYANYGLGVPTSWDDFFTAAQKMKKDDIYPLSASAKQIWLFCLSYVEQVSGRKFITEDHNLGFGKHEIHMMIDMYCRMIEEKVIPQVEYFERINLNNGKYAGTVAWVSDAINYCGAAIDNGYEFVAADYPAIDSALSGDGWTAKPATLYAVSVNTEHPEESAMLLDFLLNSRDAAILQGVEKGIPLSVTARKYLKEEEMLSGLQYEASQLMENNDRISPMDPFVENSDVYTSFIDACNKVIFDKSSMNNATAELFAYIKKSFSS